MGSMTCACVVPALVSMTCPAASNAHMTPANRNPIVPPMIASLANIEIHCTLVNVIGPGDGCTARLSSAMARNIALRTMAGMSSFVNNGTRRNATATRVAESASSSARSLSEPTIPSASTPRSLLAHHGGEPGENAVAELIEATAEQRRGDEDRDHDGKELGHVLHRLFLQLGRGLHERDQQADHGGDDDRRRGEQQHEPQCLLGERDDFRIDQGCPRDYRYVRISPCVSLTQPSMSTNSSSL